MRITERWEDGTLRERWDDSTRTYTAWDSAGTQTEQRPYNADENAHADVAATAAEHGANKSSLETNLEADLATTTRHKR